MQSQTVPSSCRKISPNHRKSTLSYLSIVDGTLKNAPANRLFLSLTHRAPGTAQTSTNSQPDAQLLLLASFPMCQHTVAAADSSAFPRQFGTSPLSQPTHQVEPARLKTLPLPFLIIPSEIEPEKFAKILDHRIVLKQVQELIATLLFSVGPSSLLTLMQPVTYPFITPYHQSLKIDACTPPRQIIQPTPSLGAAAVGRFLPLLPLQLHPYLTNKFALAQ